MGIGRDGKVDATILFLVYLIPSRHKVAVFGFFAMFWFVASSVGNNSLLLVELWRGRVDGEG